MNFNKQGIPTMLANRTAAQQIVKLSPQQIKKRRRVIDVVLIKDKELKLVEGIHATSILAKAYMEEYKHEIVWPKATGRKRPRSIVVYSRNGEQILYLDGDEAELMLSKGISSDITVLFYYLNSSK